MKKLIVIFAVVIMLIVIFTGCGDKSMGLGNMSMGFGNYNFKKIHIDMHNYSGCLTIEKWYDSTSGIEVKTEEAGYLYLAEGMYVLIENECPFCK